MINKVTIASFSMWQDHKRTSLNGMIEPLLLFFSQKVKNVNLIDGIHPGSSDVYTIFEEYTHGNLIGSHKSYISVIMQPLLKMLNVQKTQIAFKLRDFLSVMEYGIRYSSKSDIFIGLESIFTIAGILLRQLHLVNIVVYYVSDYSPNRYHSKTMNSIYLWLDRFCCKHANYIWDVSPAMMPARIKNGLKISQSAPCIIVPNALFPKQIVYLDISKRQKNSIVFAGALTPENGPDISIMSMKYILQRYPDAKLHFYGGPVSYELELKKLVKKLKLENNIFFHGLISDVTKLSKIISHYSIGFAPYREFEKSVRWYADSTKIRLYLGCGLPVITTKVPPLGYELGNAGVIAADNPVDLSKYIVKIFSNPYLHKTMTRAAYDHAKNNIWENSFSNALFKMGNI